MNTSLVFPDLARRRHPSSWEEKESEGWFAGLDLPPALYWHPGQYHERARRDLPALPGERIELVAVLRNERMRSYQDLPLLISCDHLHVLRRVQLTKDYTYLELHQSPLYWQWMQAGRLQPYTLREFAPMVRRRSVHWLREAC